MEYKQNIEEIIRIDKERRAKYFGQYDPYSGVGSLIKRKTLTYSCGGVNEKLYLPLSMFSIPMVIALAKEKSIERVLEISNLPINEMNIDSFIEAIVEARMDNDFEYWAASTVKIQEKESKKIVPFILNYPQRLLLKEMEDMRLSGVPIRIILLKARQWGGSTLVQMYMAWFQIRHFTGWHSVIMADVENQARNIRGMYSRMIKNYPKDAGVITVKPYEGSNTNKYIMERDCIIGIGSVQKPDNTRSFDIAMGHLSEVGLWKSTLSRSAEDLAQALAGAIPRKANTIIIKESTAKGVGNYFHNEWLAAINGRSGYKAVFIPWYMIPLYRENVENVEAFVSSWSDYDWWQWEQGATIDGIMWYRNFKAAESYTDWRMQSEYPTTSSEAFQSTGSRVFSPYYTLNAKRTCTPPVYIGEVHSAERTGTKSFIDIHFEKNPKGNLWIWQMPDLSIKVRNRYCGFADIGGRTERADYSILKIFDRYRMMHGGCPEVVAVWHGHLDQDLFAWKAAQICRWYNNALLAIEINSLDNKDTEGDHSYTVLDEIAPYYNNLFTRISPDKVKEGVPQRYGFHINRTSKGMIMDALNGALRENAYIEKDIRAYYEMETYENKPNGTMGAVDGQHDDHVIVTAGGVWLSLKHMDAPVEVLETVKRKDIKIIGEASF